MDEHKPTILAYLRWVSKRCVTGTSNINSTQGDFRPGIDSFLAAAIVVAGEPAVVAMPRYLRMSGYVQ